ncbi:MAG: SDR family oxidoreductase [Gracilimonas sp.]|uniref:SDR family oxidoreductase n=1 Tax=Gracilimonas TaxID=649462 RepID=UPI001B2D3261|nr:SDR family oxidoreductase [Gracilimonas sp.]MBO6584640.1 SDR family oxidoreductase [Gracilimonas sp.]MBO6616089.1 SDR family oxidoreductase [Gracilimonas sp.]
MNNKLCVITGANSGIGFETTKALAKKGAYIVMVCRNEDKAVEARQQIIDQTSNPGIDIVLCDFAIQSEIRDAAEKIKADYDKVDVLINNHGFLASDREETVDGLEKTFAVNHIGYFLFTNLLLDHIKASDYARIISVASEAHRRGEFDPENLQLSEAYKPIKAYGNSKLFNILFTKELAHRLVDSHVTANCLHPGVIASNFANSASWIMKTLFTIGKPFMASSRKGAQTSIYLAASADVENVNGAYFKNKKAATPSKTARDADAARELWKMSEKLCGL